jgi:hypothetical protein
MESKRLTVILSPAEVELVEQIRLRDGIPVAEQIRRALKQWAEARRPREGWGASPLQPVRDTLAQFDALSDRVVDGFLQTPGPPDPAKTAAIRARFDRTQATAVRDPSVPGRRARLRESVRVRDRAAVAPGDESPGARWWRERQTPSDGD